MNIGLFMWYDHVISSFADINYKINKLYCEKYNIDIIKCNKKRYNNRRGHWERIPLLLEYISKYDYLIWIDADAFFYYDANDIRNIINKNMNTNLIFSKDIGDKRVNSGFFIVKSSEYSKNFLTKWGYDEEIREYVKKRNKFNDQEGLIYMFENNILDIKNNCIEYNYGILQHFSLHNKDDKEDNTYIFHAAGRKNDYRENKSKKYINYIKKTFINDKIVNKILNDENLNNI